MKMKPGINLEMVVWTCFPLDNQSQDRSWGSKDVKMTSWLSLFRPKPASQSFHSWRSSWQQQRMSRSHPSRHEVLENHLQNQRTHFRTILEWSSIGCVSRSILSLLKLLPFASFHWTRNIMLWSRVIQEDAHNAFRPETFVSAGESVWIWFLYVILDSLADAVNEWSEISFRPVTDEGILLSVDCRWRGISASSSRPGLTSSHFYCRSSCPEEEGFDQEDRRPEDAVLFQSIHFLSHGSLCQGC